MGKRESPVSTLVLEEEVPKSLEEDVTDRVDLPNQSECLGPRRGALYHPGGIMQRRFRSLNRKPGYGVGMVSEPPNLQTRVLEDLHQQV